VGTHISCGLNETSHQEEMVPMTKSRTELLSELWDNHCRLEFGVHDADATIETMVEDPYVNHIPTMTGGVGKEPLKAFYRDHFISKLPADTTIEPVSRTIGESRVVDELIFCFTHDRVIDFLLPRIPPTNKKVRIPMVAIVTFVGDKIANEHIYWDQASVLVQIGLIDPHGLPVAGVETAEKVLNKNLPANQLIESAERQR
jgi:carboxymethylenebutenolidase